MTDFKKGILDFEGIKIGPDTKQEDFEKNFRTIFTKEQISPHVAIFLLNEKVRRLPNKKIDISKHRMIILDNMTFVNVVVLFRDQKIEKVELISDLESWDLDSNGKRAYSPLKEEACYLILEEWAIKNFGMPDKGAKYSVAWNYPWGCFRPTPYSALGGDTSVFLVEYGRNYLS